MNNTRTILVCPLDWGLGHATRCIPLIESYLNQGHRVVLAGYGDSLQLLKNEYPSLEFHHLNGFRVNYSSHKHLWWKLAWQLPNFLWHKKLEHYRLKTLVRIIRPHLIISDNRYGIHHNGVKSVIITHQLNPQVPIYLWPIGRLAASILHRWIMCFDECWVPDFADRRLSGNLSKPFRENPKIRYIGPLSRFTMVHAQSSQTDSSLIVPDKPFIAAVVSGPEPQRTVFANMLMRQLPQVNYPSVLVLGMPSDCDEVRHIGSLRIVPHLGSLQMKALLQQSELVVCRSGYSSVMDLWVLGKKALLIPTPGQTEQEYLATHLGKTSLLFIVPQDRSDIASYITKSMRYNTAPSP